MKRAIVFLFVATFLLSSCTVLDRTPSIYYNDDELSLGDITRMRFELEEAKESSPPLMLVPYDGNTTDDEAYWNEKGLVWHVDTDCGHINKEGNIFFGSVENAVECGKTRPCSYCGE